MSDMSRPSSRPPVADHERHDRLLVAQFAAGDPLKPEQQAEARRLVDDCGACAALAADLVAVSRVVAQEPVPQRRRDFRLSPEQAEELHGNAVTRFLRRLTLPSSRAFQPVAAGALSLGLAFLVVGYALPDDGVITVQAEPNYATYPLPSDVAPAAEVALSPAPAELPDDAPAGAADLFSSDSEFFEDLDEHQAGSSMRSSQKSIASEAELPAEDADRLEAAELSGIAAEPAAPKAADAVAAGEGLDEPEAAEADAAFDDSLDAVEERLVGDASRVSPEDTTQGLEMQAREPPSEEAPAVATAADEPLGSEAGDAVDGRGIIDLLIPLGLALFLGGGALLLLGWLVRRTRDPLLP